MPRLSVWFVRAALLHLAVGFTFGALLLWNKALLAGPPRVAWAQLGAWVWQLLPAHMELLLVGWTVQLALGVAYWILPRWQSQRGDVRPAWAAFFLLNTGVLIVAVAAFAAAFTWGPTVGRALEVAAAAAFALHAWPRVKPWVEGATG